MDDFFNKEKPSLPNLGEAGAMLGGIASIIKNKEKTAAAAPTPAPTPTRATRQMPDSFPKLSGEYASAQQHPRVFYSQADLNDLTGRINVSGSYSAQHFARLTNHVKADLAGTIDWDATYSGCDIYIYLHAFSIEQKDGYAGQTRSDEQLSAAMHVQSGATPPAGAAVVASRLALYAGLAKAGVTIPVGAPPPDQAIAVAKRILLAWADKGFRDESGNFRQPAAQYCDNGQPREPIATVLQIARGILYSIHAQDLLQGIGAFTPDEEDRLNRFHSGMYEVIRIMSNEEYRYGLASKHPDEIYNNQLATHLVALIAAGRLLDDQSKVETALYGGGDALTVELPWTKLFNYVMYGTSDEPMLGVTPNSSDDPLKSSPAYSTPVVAPGEINDRFRNATPHQGIGYPMGTLGWLYMAAESLRIAGYDPYGYRGAHEQTIEMATQYYAGYGKYVGFGNTVTADNATSCPNYQQYIGKIVSDVETNIVIGAYRYPGNAGITEVEPAAKTAFLHDPLDTIRFGRWRD